MVRRRARRFECAPWNIDAAKVGRCPWLTDGVGARAPAALRVAAREIVGTPRRGRQGPSHDLEHRVQHNPTQDWDLSWSHIQVPPAVAHITNAVLIETASERLRCDAEPFDITIPSDDLMRLESVQDPLQVIYEEMMIGESRTLPWGMEYSSVMIYRNRGETIWE